MHGGARLGWHRKSALQQSLRYRCRLDSSGARSSVDSEDSGAASGLRTGASATERLAPGWPFRWSDLATITDRPTPG